MDKIYEIRVEEVHDEEEGNHFYRVYMKKNGRIEIIGTSKIKPQLYRYVSKVYWWDIYLDIGKPKNLKKKAGWNLSLGGFIKKIKLNLLR